MATSGSVRNTSPRSEGGKLAKVRSALIRNPESKFGDTTSLKPHQPFAHNPRLLNTT